MTAQDYPIKLDTFAERRVKAIMGFAQCDLTTAINMIINACKREDMISYIKEHHNDVLPEGLCEGVPASEKAGGKRDGVRKRQCDPAPGPTEGPEAGTGKTARRPRSQEAVEQGRKFASKQLARRNSPPKPKLPANKVRGAKGQPRKRTR